MTITRIDHPKFRDPLTKVLDYLQGQDLRAFSAVSQAFKSDIFVYFFHRYFTPCLSKELASSPRLLGAHQQIAHSTYSKLIRPLLVSKKIEIDHWGNLCRSEPTLDGNSLIASSYNTIYIWDTNTATLIHKLQEICTDRIYHLIFTPDGKRLIFTLKKEPIIKIWDLETGTCIHILTEHTGSIVNITLTSDGNSLISRSWDKTMKIWDIKTGTCTHTHPLRKFDWWPRNTIPTADGKSLILSFVYDPNITIWDLETGTCIQTLRGHTEHITTIRLTPDGNSLISTSEDKTTKIWDIKTGTCNHTFKEQENVIDAIPSPDGNSFISVSRDNKIKIRDIKTGACIHKIASPTKAVSSATLTSDGKNFILSFYNKAIMIYDIYPLLEKWVFYSHTGHLRFSPEKIARITLLDIGQYLELVAERSDGEYREFVLAAVPFTIERIKDLPKIIKTEIHAQLKKSNCRSLCIEGDENISDPLSIKHSVEKFFSRMNKLQPEIQNIFYEELNKAATDSEWSLTRNSLLVASIATDAAKSSVLNNSMD